MKSRAHITEISASEFKAKCMALLEQVRCTRKPIRITRFGKPIADIIPAGKGVRDRNSWIGSMKDSIEILGDIISPTTDEDEWEALRDDARAAGPG